jgi:hypothetical protein
MFAMLLALRYYLAAENRRRDAEAMDETYDHVYIQRTTPDGATEKVKVDKASPIHTILPASQLNSRCVFQEYLDLTDIQNREFRYVL